MNRTISNQKTELTDMTMKLKLILWKNLIIRFQHKKLTFFQICVPFLLLGLCILKSSIPEAEPKVFDKDTYNEINHFDFQHQDVNIYYAPNKSSINNFMSEIKKKLSSEDDVEGFISESELIATLKERMENHTYYSYNSAAVIFDHFGEVYPFNLKYTIRTEMNIDVNDVFANYPYTSGGKDLYSTYPFLFVQHLIDVTYINEVVNVSTPEITVQEMPFPPHVEPSEIMDVINAPISLVLIIIFTLLYVDVVRRTLEDKISGMKELMRIVGMEVWMLWLGWFIYILQISIVTLLMTSIFMTVNLGEYKALMTHLDFSVLFIFLMICVFATVSFSFFISALFTNVSFGTSAAFVVWNINYGVASYLAQTKSSMSSVISYGFLLFPASGLPYGIEFMFDYNKFNKNIGWSDIFTPASEYYSTPTLGAILLLTLLSSIIFMMLAWYLDLVFPGEFGTGQPFYFPFTKSFWIMPIEDRSNVSLEPLILRPDVEKVPSSLRAGIQIRNLEKSFANKKAVDNLSMDIYHNELTVLLGHNGAGKTTTINIITGMTSPSNGKVLINGYSVQSDMKKVRESLGLCPQHNIHFPDLTVMQHMKFFAMLKGLKKKEAIEESELFLTKLKIYDKKDKLASTLSGGQKRRLSLGMALVGHPQVLMLDEPTSGLDPEARREIWDFLLGMRGEHTILITTHYMEEADVLGDRIAIMHEGHLECYGTSLFLKKYYGTGYVMNILMNNEANDEVITNFIQSYVPNSNTKYVSTSFVTYNLPSSNTSELSELFNKLEENKLDLGIDSFGVSITTLEDVFLKVGEIAMKTKDKLNESNIQEVNSMLPAQVDVSSTTSSDLFGENNSMWQMVLQMCWALLEKRFNYIRHTFIKFIASIIIPILLVLVFCLIPTNVSIAKNTHLELNLSIYQQPETYYSNKACTNDFVEYYKKSLFNQRSDIVPSVSESILSVGRKDPNKYYHNLVVAAELNCSETLNAMYGNMPIHGPAISLNLITNALLKNASKSNNSSISITNKPMSLMSNEAKEVISIGSMIIWAVTLPLLFVGMHTVWLNYPQDEHLTGVKHLQIMAGVPSFLYWLICYIFDLVMHFLFCVVMILFMYFIMANAMYTLMAINVFLLLCLVYGMAAFPLMYVFTHLKSHTSTQYVLLALSFLTGLFGAIAVLMLKAANYNKVSSALTYILSFSPFFTLTNGMANWFLKSYKIYKWNSIQEEQKKNQCLWNPMPCCNPDSEECHEFMSYFYDDDFRQGFWWMLGQIFLYWAVLLLFDAGYPQAIVSKLLEKRSKNTEKIDEDVQEELIRVKMQNQDNTNSDILLVKNLQKWYGKLYAVRGLNFGVHRGECFGLLGVNGAGKTTTFKMLTSEICPSTGDVHIQNLKLPSYSYLKKIGYCPQIDALNLSLTGRELLTCFAHIRGIPYNQVSSEVARWLENLDIEEYADKLSRAYSGGNKRKLNTAIALIGNPILVMLDEPTSGVDPSSRRKIWDILCEIRKSGQSIVLTSHSMEECEALCDRLTIMVNGQMNCIGPIQKLKEKYGKGFTIMLKLHIDRRNSSTDQTDNPLSTGERLKRIVENQYSCELKDEHHGMLLYHIGNKDTSLGKIFQFMENLKTQNADILEDFVVSDASLEQVFLSFAKKRDELGENKTNNVSRRQIQPAAIPV